MTELEYTCKCSQYLTIVVRNNPDYEEWLMREGNLKRRYPLTGLYSALGSEAAKARSFSDLLRIFRRFKQRHFLRIGARDFCRYADLSETTGQLSDLASVALQVGLEVLSAHPDWWAWDKELDTWRRVEGKVPLVVMGLGKLGGHELNYVSDIDLIVLHSDNEERRADESDLKGASEQGPSGSQDIIVLLSRLTHRLSRLMSDQFEGDRVFQVDFRLRPEGKEGILVPSMSGALDHYLLRGRAWERQMLLKCRPIAGERSEGRAFVQELRPFVFRRFLDFQALSELREMRNRILDEASRFRPGARHFDVKLGVGGIREVEFFVQSMQLVYGGRHPELDEPNTLRCMEKLVGLGILPQGTAEELKGSYIFLRNVEHYVQLDQNRQTQRLPHSEEGRMRLVFAMGFKEDETAFLNALEAHCRIVNSRFHELFHEEPQEEERGIREKRPTRGQWDRSLTGHGETRGHGMDRTWTDWSRTDHAGLRRLAEQSAGVRDRAAQFGYDGSLLEKLQKTLESYPASVQSAIFCGVMNTLPHSGDRELLEKILVRVDTYFGKVARRVGLRKLFGGAKPWLAPFCQAIAASELVAALLSHNPALVEGHAVREGIFIPARQWEESSRKLVERAEEYGERLEWIRRLKNERIIQLALADLSGRIDFCALEEEQTSLADFVIRNTLAAVRQNLGLHADLPLSVLAMGKLGSGEMSYLSDLDLVFVYAPTPNEPDDQIPAQVIRLIQRFINMLQTPLQEGPGYPMDVRLRPTGTHGPLVVTPESWLEYYETRADIWEIQALLRVRHIAGDPELGHWIEDKAGEICLRQRPPESVWPRICHLRSRMEKERAAETGKEIDLKLGMGGLADIEFMVQGLLLVGGAEKQDPESPPVSTPPRPSMPCPFGLKPATGGSGLCPVPASVSSLHRSVRRLVQEFLKDFSGADFGGIGSGEISAAFGALRALDHRVRLYTNSSAAKLDEQRFEAMVSLGLWPPHFDGGSIETWQDILRLRREIRGAFKRFCP